MESKLKLVEKSYHKYSKTVIHVSCSDTQLRQSEVTKINIGLVCSYAKNISDTVIFSGPLPSLTSDEMFSHMGHVTQAKCYVTQQSTTNCSSCSLQRFNITMENVVGDRNLDYFKLIRSKDNKYKNVKCKLCPGGTKTLSTTKNTTSNLLKHLK